MMFIPNSEKNKFGYYQVGPVFKSYSKFEALEYKDVHGGEVQWIFNDDFFSSLDWTVEPSESLSELYAARARQLREKYDYLVLYFSGGSDSHNILNAFAHNGIHLDEVVTFHTQGLTNSDKFSKTDHIGEVFGAAIPEFNRLTHLLPHTVHTLVDISEFSRQVLTDIETTDFKFNFVYDRNDYFGPAAMARDKISQMPKYTQLYESGKKVGFIHGIEKPRIIFNQQRWHFQFTNHVDSITSIARRQQENNSWENDELFYWDPSAWKIIVKQCHAVRNYVAENRKQIKNWLTWAQIDNQAQSNIDLSSLVLFDAPMPMEVLKTIIYPWWRQDILNFGKRHYNSTMIGNMNQWYITASTDLTSGKKFHINGIRKFADLIGYSGNLQNFKNHSFLSKAYYF